MGVPEGQRPTDAQFVQQLMLSLLGMACFNSERMLEWAAEAFDWFAAVLMPNPVRDCCLIRTNIVCVRVGEAGRLSAHMVCVCEENFLIKILQNKNQNKGSAIKIWGSK